MLKLILNIILLAILVTVAITVVKGVSAMGVKLNKKLIRIVAIIFIGLFVIGTSFYQVDQTEYVVLVTLGKPSEEIIRPGPHFKLPYPIQTVERLSTETFSMPFGYKDTPDGLVTYEGETKMITGDENIILADMEVQWKIVDPISYLYNTNNPKEVLYNATSAALRNVIGNSTVDEAMTDGRTEITNKIDSDLRNLVEKYGLGIQIVQVNLQDIDLPNAAVDEAFKAVTDARENKITLINQGNQYRNQEINSVVGKQNQQLSVAEGQKIKTIEQAKADVASFNALYSEYAKQPEITKQRLIIETMNQIIKDAKVYIMDSDGSTVKYLPLETVKGDN